MNANNKHTGIHYGRVQRIYYAQMEHMIDASTPVRQPSMRGFISNQRKFLEETFAKSFQRQGLPVPSDPSAAASFCPRHHRMP
mmetsp:Transcript_20293/g.48739  ORF Transcript_20293/g.48739 Transcript_20293/m.48739 type:complete len:83 (+) Transcript_20293:356-604(+)